MKAPKDRKWRKRNPTENPSQKCAAPGEKKNMCAVSHALTHARTFSHHNFRKVTRRIRVNRKMLTLLTRARAQRQKNQHNSRAAQNHLRRNDVALLDDSASQNSSPGQALGTCSARRAGGVQLFRRSRSSSRVSFYSVWSDLPLRRLGRGWPEASQAPGRCSCLGRLLPTSPDIPE